MLNTYEQEREPHARTMIRLALGVGWSMTAGGTFGDVIRRVTLPTLHRLPAVGAKLLDGETPPLRRSSLVRRTRAPWRLAGRLCPNPVVGPGRRLDAELGTGFAVVCLAPPDPNLRTLIQRRGAVLHLTSAKSELGQWLRRGRAMAAVLRPDRTVMHASRDLAAVCDSLPPRPPLVRRTTESRT